MLLQLNIKNFALIRYISVCFEKGFNVLLGETGAGKSILIDAINYVLGSKFEKDLIRIGENRTYVEAIFCINNENTIKVLNEMNIELEEDGMLIISRETFKSGKNIAKVNDKSVTLNSLRQITSTLLDIHGQHKNQNLLDSTNYMNYIDLFNKEEIEPFYKKYLECYKKIKDINLKIDELSGNSGENEKNIDFIKYQIDEIEKANLKIGEDEELNKKYVNLSNYEKLNKSLGTSYTILNNSSEQNLSVCDLLNLVLRNLEDVDKISDKIKKSYNCIQEAYYNIEETSKDLREILEDLYYDENELEEINKRIYEIDGYKRKYGETIEDILKYRDKLCLKYDEMIHYKDIIKSLIKQKEDILIEMNSISEKMHKIRCITAEELQKKVKNELNYVGLEKAEFKINVEFNDEFNEYGKDNIKFLISTNPGQPLKELSKVVSGGELSRIMLSLKTVFINKDKIPSIIFDEIDTGISGRIAERVGEKMYMVSTKHQVFCITHLPQIAVMSDNHYLVKKNVEDNETYTSIESISEQQKINEIAKMLSGSNLTDSAIANSKELIKNAYNKKETFKSNKNN